MALSRGILILTCENVSLVFSNWAEPIMFGNGAKGLLIIVSVSSISFLGLFEPSNF